MPRLAYSCTKKAIALRCDRAIVLLVPMRRLIVAGSATARLITTCCCRRSRPAVLPQASSHLVMPLKCLPPLSGMISLPQTLAVALVGSSSSAVDAEVVLTPTPSVSTMGGLVGAKALVAASTRLELLQTWASSAGGMCSLQAEAARLVAGAAPIRARVGECEASVAEIERQLAVAQVRLR